MIPTPTHVQRSLCLAVPMLYLVSLLVPVVHYDLWHEMAFAREVIAAHGVPLTDHFSYAPTLPVVVDHEWLSGVLAFEVFGIPHGLLLLWLSLVAPVIAFLGWALRRVPPPYALLAGFLVGPSLMYAQSMPVLAQAYSAVAAAALLFFFERYEQGSRRWLLLWIPLSILWVNLHGGIVIGFALFGAFLLEQALRRRPCRNLVVLLGLSSLSLLLTPYGWRYVPFLLRALSMPRPRGAEWQGNWILHGSRRDSVILIASFLVLGVTSFFGERGDPSNREKRLTSGALAAGVMGLLTLLAHKIIPFYGLSWLYWFGQRKWPRLSLPAGRIPPPASIAAAALIPILLLTISNKKPWQIVVPGSLAGFGVKNTQPIGPVEYLKEIGFHGNLMTSFHNGGYISWRLSPNVKVSCDARYEVAYPPEDIDRNLELYFENPAGLSAELSRLPNTDAVLCPEESHLRAELEKLRWQAAYNDDEFALYFPPGAKFERKDRRGEKILEVL